MRNILNKLKTIKAKVAATVAGGLSAIGFTTSASAAVPAALSTMFTDMATDFSTLEAAGIALVVLVVTSFALISLAKRFFKVGVRS